MDVWLPILAGEVRVTVAAGVATPMPRDDHVEDLLHRSDEALYMAKTAGRNRLACDAGVRPIRPLRQTAVS